MDNRLSRRAQVVLFMHRFHFDTRSWPTVAVIARGLELSHTMVRVYLRDLEDRNITRYLPTTGVWELRV